jgi:hypothetical protein
MQNAVAFGRKRNGGNFGNNLRTRMMSRGHANRLRNKTIRIKEYCTRALVKSRSSSALGVSQFELGRGYGHGRSLVPLVKTRDFGMTVC